MHVTTSQLLNLDVSRFEVEARVASGEWQTSDSSCGSEGFSGNLGKTPDVGTHF